MSEELSDTQTKILKDTIVVIATFSLLGALFIIANYLTFNELKNNFAFKLVFMIAIADCITAFANFLNPTHSGFYCTLQSIIQQIGDLSSIFWVSSIAFTIYYVTNSKTQIHGAIIKKWFFRYNIIIWSMTIILTILPLFTNSYGWTVGWCWITENTLTDQIMRYIVFYIPLWLAILFMSIMYCRVLQKLSINEKKVTMLQSNTYSEFRDDEDAYEDEMDKTVENEIEILREKTSTLNRIKLYPMVLIFGYLFATVLRIHDIFSKHTAPFWLIWLSAATSSSLGFWNALIYGLTPVVKQKDTQLIKDLCCGKDSEITVEFLEKEVNDDALNIGATS